MKETIENTVTPNTLDTLKSDLRQMGVHEGMTILVHSSLSSLGWTSGGAIAVVQALMEVVTENGTLVMPTQSGDWSDPKEWEEPPVPEEWWVTIRATMPAYDAATTPTLGMGKVVEAFRTFPGVLRSQHPNVSFAAWGKKKETIILDHELTLGLGEHSPLARLYDARAKVLFMGTSYETNTCFHLGEYRAPNPKYIKKGAPVIKDGVRIWKPYQEIAFEEDLFEEVGMQFEKKLVVIKTTSVNWWFALRLKASLTGLGLKGPLNGFPSCTTFPH